MITINLLDDDDPVLNTPGLFDALCKTMAYAKENGGVPLTTNKLFNSEFINWAGENFNWPNYTTDKFLENPRAIRQADIPPLDSLYDFICTMKYGRHAKGKFHFPQRTYNKAKRKGRFFVEFVTNYLINYDHKIRSIVDPEKFEHWQIYLNAINRDCHDGATSRDILYTLYGFGAQHAQLTSYKKHNGYLHGQFLKPLSRLGFLEKINSETAQDARQIQYRKTMLWHKVMNFNATNKSQVKVPPSDPNKKFRQPKALPCL